jgi:peptidyl-prolyl cis-trans isomerase B (cyclophilin B)
MRPLSSLLAVSAVLLAAGCGGSGDSLKKAVAQASQARTAAAAPTTRTVTIEKTATAPSEGCTAVSPPQPHPERTHLTASTTRLDPNKQWTLILDTNCGLISIDLAVKQSPKTTAAFAGLVNSGFFNGLTFHRVSNGPDGTPFVIQGGDPLGTGLGGPGYQVVEPPPSNADYSRGVVAMAKTPTDPSGASGSQFFIVTAADAQLPPQYALLGHLSAGMAAVARIAAQPTQGNEMPVSPVVIRSATLRPH